MRARWIGRLGAACVVVVRVVGLGSAGAGAQPGGGSAVARAAAGPATPGTYYGHEGDRVFTRLTVGSDGTRLIRQVILFKHGRCTDGSFIEDATIKFAHLAITPSGAADFRGVFPRAYRFDRRGRRVYGRLLVVSTFQFTGTHLTGTTREVFRSKSLKCESGTVPFVADLAGTGAAAFQTPYALTGRYTGTDEINRPVALTVFTPWNLVTGYSIVSLADECTAGLTVATPDHWRIGAFTIQGHSFDSVTTFVQHGHGLIVHQRLTMRGTLHQISTSPVEYVASVVFDNVAQVYRGRHYVGRCTTGRYVMQLVGHSHAEQPENGPRADVLAVR